MRKPFDIEAARNGAKVVTRDGRSVEILKYNYNDTHYPLIAVITNYDGSETVEYFTEHGYLNYCLDELQNKSQLDLFLEVEPTYRPYSSAEEFLNDMKEHGPMGKNKDEEKYCLIVSLNERGVQFSDENSYTYEKLKKLYTWQDGHPCGVQEGGEECRN